MADGDTRGLAGRGPAHGRPESPDHQHLAVGGEGEEALTDLCHTQLLALLVPEWRRSHHQPCHGRSHCGRCADRSGRAGQRCVATAVRGASSLRPDLLEGVATGDGEEAFTAVLGAVLRDDIDLIIPEGEVLADVPELCAIDGK